MSWDGLAGHPPAIAPCRPAWGKTVRGMARRRRRHRDDR